MGLDARSVEFVLGNIDRITDPMARTLCWSAMWEMTRDGRLRARDFAGLVARGARRETELAVLERVLAQAGTAVRSYADPAWADTAGRELLAGAWLAGVREGTPESSLVFAQALTRVGLTEEAADYLRSVVNGTASYVTVDADLRWLALTALIAHGDYADAEEVAAVVAEQRRRDPSATGGQAALRATAALNTVATKQAVWEEVVAGELSNLDARHRMEGLTYPGSGESLAPLGARYFEVAEELWERFSTEMALRSLTGLYPGWDISREGLDRATDFLARDLPAGLARVVAEQRARVERALRNRAVDAQAPRG